VDLFVGPTREGHWTAKRDQPRSMDDRFLGENLVFVMGAPRSGTTWVLKLLEEHPDVVAANVDNLGIRKSDARTLETGIFESDVSDREIRRRFWSLAMRNDGKVVVEKTPVHLMHVDRIKRVFPRAALVLVRRGGRDTFASMLAAGRDEKSWWKGAPGTAREAAELWRDYAVAASRCEGCYDPLVVRYEDLRRDPFLVVDGLYHALDLIEDTAATLRAVEACRNGKNIPIKGVFRRGQIGGWKDVLSGDDLETFEVVAGRWDWKPMPGRNPVVTVVLSSFERPDGLERSFRSLLDQSMWKDMEVIICDDGSGSSEVKSMLQRFGSNGNVTVIRGEEWPVDRKEKFCTFTQLLNRAMHVAGGKYVTYLCDGDEYRSGRCARYADILDRRADVFLVWGRSQWMRDGKRQPKRQQVRMSTDEVRRKLPRGNFVDHCEFMHRRTDARWSTSPDSWRFADWLFLQRLLLRDVEFAPVDVLGQVKHYDEDSLGRAMGEEMKSFRWVHARRAGRL
jgi:hypothetical protein